MFINNFSQVNQSVSHSPQCRVDTHSRLLTYFLKAHVFVNAHGQDLFLILGQLFNESLNIFLDLIFDHTALRI